MSDNIIKFPGADDDTLPCDTEPSDGYNEPETIVTLTTEFTKAIEDHRSKHVAEEVNPNEGSTTFPYIRVIWVRDATGVHIFHRVQTAQDYYQDLPISTKEAIEYATDLLDAATGKL